MGGMATYDMALRYPELFAEAVPICGTVNPQRFKKTSTVPMRIFHGDADSEVQVEASRRGYLALKKNHAQVEYKEYPGVIHGSWVNAFNEPDFLEWIYKHHK